MSLAVAVATELLAAKSFLSPLSRAFANLGWEIFISRAKSVLREYAKPSGRSTSTWRDRRMLAVVGASVTASTVIWRKASVSPLERFS